MRQVITLLMAVLLLPVFAQRSEKQGWYVKDYNESSAKAYLDNNYYLDFQDNLKNLERGQTPFSPATTLFMQVNERMHRNLEKGIGNVIAATREKALYFRRLCAKYGWEIPAHNPANAVTGFFVHKNADILCDELQKHGIFIMPSGKPHFFRVSHMGSDTYQDLDDLAGLISEIENLPR